MKLFRFDPQIVKMIDQYSSSEVRLSKVVHLFEGAVVSCAYLDTTGVIGYHQSTIPQLFLVVQGEGWVKAEAPRKTSIQTGQAAYWEKGEWHESGTETGMTVIIIEGINFDPAKWMPPV